MSECALDSKMVNYVSKLKNIHESDISTNLYKAAKVVYRTSILSLNFTLNDAMFLLLYVVCYVTEWFSPRSEDLKSLPFIKEKAITVNKFTPEAQIGFFVHFLSRNFSRNFQFEKESMNKEFPKFWYFKGKNELSVSFASSSRKPLHNPYFNV